MTTPSARTVVIAGVAFFLVGGFVTYLLADHLPNPAWLDEVLSFAQLLILVTIVALWSRRRGAAERTAVELPQRVEPPTPKRTDNPGHYIVDGPQGVLFVVSEGSRASTWDGRTWTLENGSWKERW